MTTYNVGYDLTDNIVSIDTANLFTIDLSDGGSFTVDVDAYVRNSSPTEAAAAVLRDGPWIVTINGLLEQTGAPLGSGLILNAVSSTLKSTITIGENGVVRAGTNAITSGHSTTITLSHATSYLEASERALNLLGASNTVTNKGYITSTSGPTVVELFGGGNHTVTNSGTIATNFPDGFAIQALNATKTTVTNQSTGTIFGQVVLGAGNDVITNSGYMDALQLGDGNNTVTNSGAASSISHNSANKAIVAGGGNDVVSNVGDIVGDIDLGNGDNRITGAGRLLAVTGTAITLGSGNDTVSVTGLIQGAIELGDGRNMVSVSQSGSITGGSGNDTVMVSKAVNGTVDLGEGNNSISGAGSVVEIILGSGNDTVTLTGDVLGPMDLGGGRNIASVGQSGAITGGSGNDTVSASKNVNGDINLFGGINSFTGAANVLGNITLGEFADTLNVKGLVGGAIALGNGNNTATVGEVQGKLTGGNENDVIAISTLLTGDVSLGEGKNSIKGAGSIVATTIVFGNNDDVLALAGKITGDVDLGNAVTKNTATISELQGNLTGGTGNDVVTVSKLVTGTINLLGGTNSLTGAGAVNGDILLGAGDDTLALTGKITGNVALGNAVIKNTANISELQGSLLGGDQNDIVTLSKLITGGVSLGAGNNTLNGLGGVTLGVVFGDGDDVLSLSGTIGGNVDLGGAITKNTATVGNVSGMITGAAQNDMVTVNGEVLGGISLGDGADKLTLGAQGYIDFMVSDRNFLGAGDDEYIGNSNIAIDRGDRIGDGDGNDKYTLLGGDDWFYAGGTTSDGLDTVDGGIGIDTYDATTASTAVYINLSATPAPLTDILLNSTPLGGSIQASKATGAAIGTDTVLLFENAFGGGGDDVIVGTTGSNYLIGSGGGDTLFGLAGNDMIEGGSDKDQIVGGVGADFLWGSSYFNTDGASDTFHYRSISEST